MTLEGKAPWLKDHPAGAAEVAYYPFIDPAPIYTGVNAVLLDLVAAERGFKDPRWIPMAMVESNKLTPKYGEKPVCLAFRNRFVEVTDTNPISGTVASALSDSAKRISYYYVYNAEQIRGMPPLQKDRDTTLVKMKTENALKNTGAKRTSELIQSFSKQLPSHNCDAKETLAAIAKYRLACQLRLPYKADVNLEKARREVQKKRSRIPSSCCLLCGKRCLNSDKSWKGFGCRAAAEPFRGIQSYRTQEAHAVSSGSSSPCWRR